MQEFYIEDIENWIRTLPTAEAQNIVNLSNWNPSSEFMNQLAINIPFTFEENPISYIFSSDYKVDLRNKLLRKWGYKVERGITFFNTGSESILNTLYLLLHFDCKKIYLLCPTYFSIEPICNTLGIECRRIHLIRKEKRYYIPKEQIQALEKDSCLWITNPIYCTGNTYLPTDIAFLKQVIIEKNLFLVNDESLCYRSDSLCNMFETLEKYVNIVTPHKALCTNGLKFSAIIYSTMYETIVDKWADTLQGCLGIGASAAIKHFISKHYDIYEQSFIKCIKNNKATLVGLLNKYNLDFDIYSKSYLLSLYFSNITSTAYDDINKMKELIHKNNAFIITGSKNSFNPFDGLSFRVNLCAFNSLYLHTLERTLIYLKEENTL